MITTSHLLQHMAVSGYPALYVLGSFERRVTVYSQQVRALNLVYSLIQQGHLSVGKHVVVVGGGVAGLTAAAGALQRGCQVTVLEKNKELLHLFANCTKRWLHPRIYDWPSTGALDPDSDLPVLTWTADWAGEVATSLHEQWRTLATAHRDQVCVLTEADIDALDPANSGCRISYNHPEYGWDEKRPDVVILAVGFGIEKTWTSQIGLSSSYWHDNAVEQSDHDRDPHYLISGTGDGGLTDLLRATIRNFRHDKIVANFMLDPTAHEKARILAQSLEKIETTAISLAESHGDQRAAEYITDAYLNQLTSQASFIDTLLKPSLRDGRKVALNGPDRPLTLGASILNRLLASRVLRLGGATYHQGRISEPEVAQDRWSVKFKGRLDRKFTHVIRRHGTDSALETGFRDVYNACRASLEARNVLDQTRERLWDAGFFNGPGSVPTTQHIRQTEEQSADKPREVLQRKQQKQGGTTTSEKTHRLSRQLQHDTVPKQSDHNKPRASSPFSQHVHLPPGASDPADSQSTSAFFVTMTNDLFGYSSDLTATSDSETVVRMLLVEDNTINQKITIHIVEKILGWDVVTVSNGRSAIQKLEQESFDIVLTDWQMPVMDGIELTRHLLNESPKMLVIMVTAYAIPGSMDEFFRLGGYDVIYKPWSRDVFCTRLRNAVHAHLTGYSSFLNGLPKGVEIKKHMEGVRQLTRKINELDPTDIANALLQHHMKRLVNGFVQTICQHKPGSDDIGRLLQALKLIERFARSRDKHNSSFKTYIEEYVSEHRAMHRGVKIVLSINADDIEIDDSTGRGALISMVVVELIENATTAIRERGRIEILIQSLRARSILLLEVTDSGPGVEEGERQRIFEEGVTTAGPGHGFGLHLSRMLISRMDGTIGYIRDENEDCSSRFAIRLPLGS